MVLHLVAHSGSSQWERLREKFKFCLVSHLRTAGQSSSRFLLKSSRTVTPKKWGISLSVIFILLIYTTMLFIRNVWQPGYHSSSIQAVFMLNHVTDTHFIYDLQITDNSMLQKQLCQRACCHEQIYVLLWVGHVITQFDSMPNLCFQKESFLSNWVIWIRKWWTCSSLTSDPVKNSGGGVTDCKRLQMWKSTC